MKAIELYFHLVLFIVLNKSVDEILKCEYSKPENVLKCDHINESCSAELFSGHVFIVIIAHR